ncbi:tetratricopeptide repeat protein [Streptomyces sp. NPDC006704]|uniref:tetratricopeptide repeat protein n=1 Tax=Streptomyces sp. NPDC006704 TaxID=3364760 RepID=UPI00368E3859
MNTAPAVADQLVWAGRALHAGAFDEAATLYEQALQQQEQDTATGLTDIAQTRYDLALCRYGQQRYADGEALLRRVVDIRREAFGAVHPSVVRAQSRLVEALGEQGKWEEASRLALETVALGEALGHRHESAIEARLALAWSWYKLGQFEAAARLAAHVTLDLRAVRGADHPQTLSARHLEVGIARERGQWRQAERQGRQILAARERVLGAEHPHTVLLRVDLAEILHHAGHAEAAAFAATTLPLCEQVLGPSHRRTIAAKAAFNALSTGT